MNKVSFFVTVVLLGSMLVPVIPLTSSPSVEPQYEIVTTSPLPQQISGLQIVNPVDGVTLGDTVTIHIEIDPTIHDNSTVQVFLNDTLFATGLQYHYWDADTFAEGDWVIKVTVDLLAGGSEEITSTVTVDHSFETGIVSVMNYNIGEGGRYGNFWEVIGKWGLDIILMVETGAFPGNDNPEMSAFIAEWNAQWPNRAPYDYYQLANFIEFHNRIPR